MANIREWRQRRQEKYAAQGFAAASAHSACEALGLQNAFLHQAAQAIFRRREDAESGNGKMTAGAAFWFPAAEKIPKNG